MTTNKPRVVCHEVKAVGAPVTLKFIVREDVVDEYMSTLSERHPVVSSSPLIRLSDYEALQSEYEKLRKDAETERQLQRAAQHLPEGWRLVVEVERDAGWIDIFNPDGKRLEIDGSGNLAEQIEQAIDASMQGGGSHDNQ